MTISKLLKTGHPTLKGDDLISTAARLLLDHELSSLPVVDEAGCYLGIFSMHRLFSLLLPKAALIEGGVSDLAFVSDQLEILCERMREHGAQTVSEALVTDAPVVHPDTPLLEMVLLLYRNGNDIPMVGKQDGRFLGMVSGTDLLGLICPGK